MMCVFVGTQFEYTGVLGTLALSPTSLPQEERRQFLQFCTGSASVSCEEGWTLKINRAMSGESALRADGCHMIVTCSVVIVT